MPPENNVVTRTAPYRSAAEREIMRIGAVVVVGDGSAPDTLRRPRIQPVADLTLDIGRRAGTGSRPTLTL
ncbi:MAG TPA: hypothetical protein VLT58_07660, partial [Polyangia bacterium]|nr:hypothetical protein [Polyangia bacterium]